MPTIAVRDLEIQRRESDLVVGTFGRGIYILDDYSPLRAPDAGRPGQAGRDPADQEGAAVRPGRAPGRRREGVSRSELLHGPQPPLRRDIHVLPEGRAQDRRRRRGASKRRSSSATARTWSTRAGTHSKPEDREEPPALILTIRNAAGQVVRRLGGPTSAGLHRVSWDLRWPGYRPMTERAPAARGDDDDEGFSGGGRGPLALPGQVHRQPREARGPGHAELVPRDAVRGRAAELRDARPARPRGRLAFAQQTGELQRAALGALEALNDGLKPADASSSGSSSRRRRCRSSSARTPAAWS